MSCTPTTLSEGSVGVVSGGEKELPPIWKRRNFSDDYHSPQHILYSQISFNRDTLRFSLLISYSNRPISYMYARFLLCSIPPSAVSSTQTTNLVLNRFTVGLARMGWPCPASAKCLQVHFDPTRNLIPYLKFKTSIRPNSLHIPCHCRCTFLTD